MCTTHNKCQASAATQVQYFPDKGQHLKNLQDKLQTYEQSIQNIKNISEEAIRIWVVQASVHKYLFEELLRKNSPKVKEIDFHLAKHELNARLLELVEYRVIEEEATTWKVFIGGVVGPS